MEGGRGDEREIGVANVLFKFRIQLVEFFYKLASCRIIPFSLDYPKILDSWDLEVKK